MTSREPFIMIPRAMLYADLSPEAIRLWAVLDDLCRLERAVPMDQRELARVIDVGYRKARYVVDELVAAAFLAVHPRPGKGHLYEPLHRPRRPAPVTAQAVDNARLTLARLCQGASHDPGTRVPGSTRLLISRAREGEVTGDVDDFVATPHHGLDIGDELEPGPPPPPKPQRVPWCGSCDARTRLRDDDRGIYRCPTCHPLTQPPF